MKVANPVEESWRVQLRAICTVSVRVDKEESTAFRHSASCQAATSHSVGTKEIWCVAFSIGVLWFDRITNCPRVLELLCVVPLVWVGICKAVRKKSSWS